MISSRERLFTDAWQHSLWNFIPRPPSGQVRVEVSWMSANPAIGGGPNVMDREPLSVTPIACIAAEIARAGLSIVSGLPPRVVVIASTSPLSTRGEGDEAGGVTSPEPRLLRDERALLLGLAPWMYRWGGHSSDTAVPTMRSRDHYDETPSRISDIGTTQHGQ
jgi:hypothetical protein